MNILSLRTHTPSPIHLLHIHPPLELPIPEEVPGLSDTDGCSLLMIPFITIFSSQQQQTGADKCHVSSGPGLQGPILPTKQFPYISQIVHTRDSHMDSCFTLRSPIPGP